MATENLEVGELISGSNDLTALFEQAAGMPDNIDWHEAIGDIAVGTVALRNDYHVEFVDLEPYQPTPRRAMSAVQLADTQSFVDFVKRFPALHSESVIYVNRTNAVAEVVFDDHGAEPGWRNHRAMLIWAKSEEWKRWVNNDRKMLAQDAFAEHIEDGLSEITDPAAADLLEMAQNVKANLNANITSARYLRDGTVKLNWDETLSTTAGSGDTELPSHFTLQMAPFEGGTPITITARLRYRFKERTLTLGYILDRPRDQEKIALDAEISLIVADVPDVLMVMGHPGP